MIQTKLVREVDQFYLSAVTLNNNSERNQSQTVSFEDVAAAERRDNIIRPRS